MEEIKEVFISYHENSAKELVADIADKLESAGISCWYARRNISKGDDFTQEIMRQLNGCQVFLLVLNQGAVQSLYVQNELTIAFDRKNHQEKIDILPFRVEDCAIGNMRLHLANAQILDAFEEPKEHIGALVTEVAHKLGREPAKNGWCGPGIRWKLRDGALTIFKDEIYGIYNRRIGDFYYQNIPKGVNTPWWNEREKITSISIGDNITYIGRSAFRYFSKLAAFSVPIGITEIGNYAFSNCAALASVTLNHNLAVVGIEAFRGCSALANVNMPDSIASIKSGAFMDCPNLKSVSVPASAEIADDAFDDTTEVIRRRL